LLGRNSGPRAVAEAVVVIGSDASVVVGVSEETALITVGSRVVSDVSTMVEMNSGLISTRREPTGASNIDTGKGYWRLQRGDGEFAALCHHSSNAKSCVDVNSFRVTLET
jgi:hypothetical protein